ncbi:MAG: 50S ribosomal protein L10, partial [Candidatus Omnitrophota bacterium]|nr:50S ribosomal protein L10 [Candidatus Omnitrophota bacterium]
IIGELTNRFQRVKTLIFTGFNGLSAMEMNELRRKFDEQSGQYLVVKNRLAKLALEKTNLSKGLDLVKGSVGIAISGESPEGAAKFLVDFSKKHQALNIYGALLDAELFSGDYIKTMAALPSRKVLLAGVAGGLNAPLSGLVNTLNEVIRKFVSIVDKIKEKKEKK